MQLRRIWKGILALPLVLLALLVLYEAAGMAVNHWAGGRQTREMVRHLEKTLPQTEILDRYTEVGNTSGTGNHVDLLSAVLFRTAADPESHFDHSLSGEENFLLLDELFSMGREDIFGYGR